MQNGGDCKAGALLQGGGLGVRPVHLQSTYQPRFFSFAHPVQPGNVALEEHDPELFDIIEREKNRQWKSLELIASEVGIPWADAALTTVPSTFAGRISRAVP